MYIQTIKQYGYMNIFSQSLSRWSAHPSCYVHEPKKISKLERKLILFVIFIGKTISFHLLLHMLLPYRNWPGERDDFVVVVNPKQSLFDTNSFKQRSSHKMALVHVDQYHNLFVCSLLVNIYNCFWSINGSLVTVIQCRLYTSGDWSNIIFH